METDVFHHFTQQFDIRRRFAIRHPAAEHAAQHATEIFVTGVREEAAAVSQHADEATQQTELGQLCHLTFHAVLLIVEPPAGTELHLAGNAIALEITQHGRQHFVIARVQAVKNGFRQLVIAILCIQQTRQRGGNQTIVDGVKAGVRPQFQQTAAVVIAQCTDVVLLHPATLFVLFRQEQQDGSFEGGNLFRREDLALTTRLQHGSQFRVRGFAKQHYIQCMIRNLAAMFFEVIQTYS